MASYYEELLKAARLVLRRRGRVGKLSSARVRRSISTSYYALFHFLLDEAGRSVIGTANDLRRRRRALGRTMTHSGIRVTMEKIRGASVNSSVQDFLRHPGTSGPVVCVPSFAQELARAFLDVHLQRMDADYDLNKSLSERDAVVVRNRVRRAIAGWRAAKTPSDKDFKSALCVLMLLNGKLRTES